MFGLYGFAKADAQTTLLTAKVPRNLHARRTGVGETAPELDGQITVF